MIHRLFTMMLLTLSACATFQAHPDDSRMDWWREARFGMFIHWGLYAIPAGTWNGEEIPGIGEWIMYRAQIPPEEYEKLAPEFNPEQFDADAWAALAAHAGMKYMVITSKHHDGFCLFDSEHTEYDIMDATPFKRDILLELAEACADHDLKMCWYHSIMDWHHPDAKGERFPEYAEVMKAQVKELLTRYDDIGIMWFDGQWIEEWTVEQGRDLYAFCLELQPEVIVNNRVGKGRHSDVGDYGTPEQYIPAKGLPGKDWETCMTMNDTWGFKTSDCNWKSAETMIRMLAETASKGGNFLLNVGPTAAGLIPEPSVQRLEAMGAWLEKNGESVYGTTAGPFNRLPWGRCTTGAGRLYLHVFDWPLDGCLKVPGLMSDVKNAYFLGEDESLAITREGPHVLIDVPGYPRDAADTVVVLEIEGKAKVDDALRSDPHGRFFLEAVDAEVKGDTARYEPGADLGNIGYWSDLLDTVHWKIHVDRPGRYFVMLEYACPSGEAGSAFEVRIDMESLEGTILSTGSWTRYALESLGPLSLAGGEITVSVVPISLAHKHVMNLRSLRLVPAP